MKAEKLPEILEKFRKMQDVAILHKTADLIEQYCGGTNLEPFSALDILTLLLRYAQPKVVCGPENCQHDKIASIPTFTSLAMEIEEMSAGEWTQRAQLKAWTPFIQVAISELRGPAFPQVRFFPIINGVEMLADIDDIALRIVDEIKNHIERHANDTAGYDAVAALTNLGTQLKCPRDLHFETVQLWHKFLNGSSISDEQKEDLTKELFRVVTNAVTWPTLTPVDTSSTVPLVTDQAW